MHDKNDTYMLIDKLGHALSDTVVPIFINDPNSPQQILGLGSGFLVIRKRHIFLVTAYHVMKNNSNDILTVNIKGKSASLNNLPFFKSEEDDLAIFPLDERFFLTCKIHEIDRIPLDISYQEKETVGGYFLLGYPGSKNVLNKIKGHFDRKIYCFSFYEKVECPQSETQLPNPIAFYFDKNDTVETNGAKRIPPNFAGCSGGPVFEVLIDKSNNIDMQLLGIFQGWHKQTKEVICIRSEKLNALIDTLIAKLQTAMVRKP